MREQPTLHLAPHARKEVEAQKIESCGGARMQSDQNSVHRVATEEAPEEKHDKQQEQQLKQDQQQHSTETSEISETSQPNKNQSESNVAETEAQEPQTTPEIGAQPAPQTSQHQTTPPPRPPMQASPSATLSPQPETLNQHKGPQSPLGSADCKNSPPQLQQSQQDCPPTEQQLPKNDGEPQTQEIQESKSTSSVAGPEDPNQQQSGSKKYQPPTPEPAHMPQTQPQQRPQPGQQPAAAPGEAAWTGHDKARLPPIVQPIWRAQAGSPNFSSVPKTKSDSDPVSPPRSDAHHSEGESVSSATRSPATRSPASRSPVPASRSPAPTAKKGDTQAAGSQARQNQCINCGARETPLWRRGLRGEVVCNACGLYLRARNAPRPLNLKRTPRTKIVFKDGEGGGDTDVPPPGSCPGNGECNGTGGGSECGDCASYKNHILHSKKVQVQTDDLATETKSERPAHKTSPRQAEVHISCKNCGTVTTPLWRRYDNGNVVCNACGLYLRAKKEQRPAYLNRAVIKRRRRLADHSETTSSTSESEDNKQSPGPAAGRHVQHPPQPAPQQHISQHPHSQQNPQQAPPASTSHLHPQHPQTSSAPAAPSEPKIIEPRVKASTPLVYQLPQFAETSGSVHARSGSAGAPQSALRGASMPGPGPQGYQPGGATPLAQFGSNTAPQYMSAGPQPTGAMYMPGRMLPVPYMMQSGPAQVPQAPPALALGESQPAHFSQAMLESSLAATLWMSGDAKREYLTALWKQLSSRANEYTEQLNLVRMYLEHCEHKLADLG